MTITYQRYRPEDFDGLFSGFRQAFNATVAGFRHFQALTGDGNARVMKDGDVVAGGARFAPQGHWFGGRAVPSIGVPGLVVHPAYRGKGVGQALIRGMLEEFHADGVGLVSLYPSTTAFYRKQGFRPGGTIHRYSAQIHAMLDRPVEADVTVWRAPDRAVLEDLHDRYGRRFGAGLIRRSPYLWTRALHPFERAETDTYLLNGPDGPEGYITLLRDKGFESFEVCDYVALTPHAVRQALAMLVGHGATANRAEWFGGPQDPLVQAMHNNRFDSIHVDQWLMRIVDLGVAISQRGYQAGVETAFVLELDDPVLPANRGRFAIRVEGGRGRVDPEPGDAPALRLGIGALAPLYTGFLTAFELAGLGLAEGPPEALAAASLAFAGPAPWLTEKF
ncbi:GNAT family N-acetyltransferase [Marinivivus vitaminiproducens]|uniref:GNAT family N-acetyltransferase n=1 Tax=Marinivivus vitaminiproducens TaxID=3035935 RepID=UPI0027AAF133|nr:GNAT family N-acetyltransferase [Geminicoccaceae bacterium SCSIO 64248]